MIKRKIKNVLIKNIKSYPVTLVTGARQIGNSTLCFPLLFDFYIEIFIYCTVKLRTTHVVNNCVKRHVNIPTYSTSAENVMINEYVQGQPMYQQPMVYTQFPQQPYMPGQYQGNVGTDPFGPQPTTPNVSPQNFQGFVPPMGNVPFGF